MKICKTKFRTLIVLIITLAPLTACSSDSEILNNQPVNPTARTAALLPETFHKLKETPCFTPTSFLSPTKTSFL